MARVRRFDRDELPTDRPDGPPPRWRLLTEARVAWEIAYALASWPFLGRPAPGRGEPVLVIPGFGGTDIHTFFLRRHLRRVGFDARGWGLGRNHGDVAELRPQILALVERMKEEHDAPVDLVGWSLGGYLARELARDRPDLVRRVVTLGAPVVGGPKYTFAAAAYERTGHDLDAIEEKVDARYEVPLEVPVTAVFSRGDGIVAWKATIDLRSDDVDHVQIEVSHLGMVVHPTVLRFVAGELEAVG